MQVNVALAEKQAFKQDRFADMRSPDQDLMR